MIRGQRRAGVAGAILRAAAALVVLGLVCPGSAVAAERPSRKTTPQRSLRSTTNPPPLPIDASPLRMRVETREGVLVVFDAAIQDDDEIGCSGFSAYWTPEGELVTHVFGRVLNDESDLEIVLQSLHRDFGVDVEELGSRDVRLTRAMKVRPADAERDSGWEPLTLDRGVEIMGFDPSNVDDLQDDNAPVACACMACAAGIPPPQRCDSPHALVREALAIASDCCGCACSGPCCGSSNPCCGSSDRCCGANCSDGNACTIDGCNRGCYHIPKNCDDGDVCTYDSCNPSTGACTNTQNCSYLCCPTDSSYFCGRAGDAVCCDDPGYLYHGCWAGETCCGAGCCPAQRPYCCKPSTGLCCASAADCCNGHCRSGCQTTCCPGGWCQGECCGQACCGLNQSCCYGECCGGVCLNASCVNNACVTTPACDDGNPCTNDICTPGTCSDFTCSHTFNSDSCTDDDNSCTDDLCSGGACTHPAIADGSWCPDDHMDCTYDYCSGGVCVHPVNCAGGEVCCGGMTCCSPLNCCPSGLCCPVACFACLQWGELSGGAIDVQPPTVCVGGTISFTVSGVSDSGGTERTNCYGEIFIPPGTLTYTWRITKPDRTKVPPADQPPGSGSVGAVVADIPGAYSCVFTARASRECPPGDLDIAPATARAVHVEVTPARVDATDPHAAKVWYHVDPHDVTLRSAAFSAPGTTQTAENVGTDFYFTFDQGNLPTGVSQIELTATVSEPNCPVTAADVTATRTPTHAPPQNVVSEIAFFKVPVDAGGVPAIITISVLHSISAQFAFVCYSVPVVLGSKTLWVGIAHANIETTHGEGIPTEIAAWTERQLYRNAYGDYLEQIMLPVTGPTVPPQTLNYRSADLSVNSFFAPHENLAAIARIDTIVFKEGADGDLVFPILLLSLNTEVDLPLEANAGVPTACP